ncbi:MAG: butyrate kinase [Paludibacteraceae bacterium]|nr:butyrate kinase [Paludibacteraceae bacterium]MBQ8715681.1 butyrate kinase [Prevotella sp.]
MKILVINPGSTSTKIAVYEDEKPILLRNITHSAEELASFGDITEQQDFRRQLVLEELRQAGIPMDFAAVIGRGGMVKPIAGGVYEINDQMIDDTLHGCVMHNHACNLGCLIAHEIATMFNSQKQNSNSKKPACRAFIADPGVVDELSPLARISGSPLMPRICIWHALNQRAIARRFARGIGKEYEDLNLIICHLGGGISVAAHEHGRAIDANNALDGEGSFSPERAGSLPAADLIRLCFSGKYTEKQLLKRIAGQAGLTAHLGTNNMREILERIKQGDEHAQLLVDAMLYHTAKQIASEAAVLCGDIDAILLTGGMAHSDYIVSELRRRIGFLAPVYCFPGENEMEALALNALAVLQGKREAKVYK